MKMRISVLMIFAGLLCLIQTPVIMAVPTVVLDQQRLSFELPPLIADEHTLVPMRAIFEAIGATVTWDQSTLMATAVKGNTTVSVRVGSPDAYKK